MWRSGVRAAYSGADTNVPTGSYGSVGKMPPNRSGDLSSALQAAISLSHDGKRTTPYACAAWEGQRVAGRSLPNMASGVASLIWQGTPSPYYGK